MNWVKIADFVIAVVVVVLIGKLILMTARDLRRHL